ncbi:hypothetical protein BDV59DRAFT_86282 [Aspergillus ambiguus]|uniref:uncharacterized protein n=1 Tax=Aspergillus ambiguus TaxID=176160 RepID=UPI003CCCAE32
MRTYVSKSLPLTAMVITRGRNSMILSASRRLCLAVLSSVPWSLAIGSDESQPTMSPASTFGSIPRCASDCVKEFIRVEYPDDECSNGQDFDCLCRTRAKNGYTLGEAALQCSFSLCPMEEALKSNSYGICDSVSGALRGTHGTITATVVAVTRTTTTVKPVTTDPNTSSNSTLSSKDEYTATTLATFQSPLSVTRTRQDPSGTSDAGSTSTRGASSGSNLNAGAVIGVSVASGVSGFFILGVIIFFCCRKIRRKHPPPKDRNSFFEIGGLMSEPSNFSLPRTRPSPRPDPPSHAVEISRPMLPFQRTAQNPTVTVTRPDHDYDDNHRGFGHLNGGGFAFSSTSDLDSPTQSSPRTISDLLPDKPGLYPEPLRWSQHKSPRPNSGETLFEEDATRPRSILGVSNQPNVSGSLDRYQYGQQPDRPAMVGLPVNPRAMMYGFRGPGNGNPITQGPDYRKKPVFANASEKLLHPRQADIYGNVPCPWSRGDFDSQRDYVGDYWANNGGEASSKPTSSSSRSAARRSFHAPVANPGGVDYVEDNFETININDHQEPRRTSRHSGNFRPLTPVREVQTPVNAPQRQRPDYFDDNASVQYPRMPLSGTVSPSREIVSRPRIVRQDDIKRVHIRRGKSQPKASTLPYSPEDYWVGRDRGSPSKLHPYDRRRLSGEYQELPYKADHMPQRKPPP